MQGLHGGLCSGRGVLLVRQLQKADVLYVTFRKPQRATETIELEDDILLRKDGRDIVALTIMSAGRR